MSEAHAKFMDEKKVTIKNEYLGTEKMMDTRFNVYQDKWKSKLRYKGRIMTVPFFKGQGHNGEPPTAVEVLACMILDTFSVESAGSLEVFCNDLGYDQDSRLGKTIYNACEKQAIKLRKFLGDDFDEFAEALNDY